MNIAQMSLQASVIILAAIAIRALGMGKLPKWSFQLLWAVAAARLLLPVRIESPVSVYGAVALPVWADAPGMPAPMALSQAGAALAAPRAAPVSPWPIVWLVGAGLLLGYFAFTHMRCLTVYRKARTLSKTRVSKLPLSRPLNIRASQSIDAPLTYGILRPVILLPRGLVGQGRAVRYVIAHELYHVRHWDILKRWLLTLCLCAHWFNPLVWAMYVLAGRDMELCCDEAVLRGSGSGQRARYATLLIDLEAARTAATPLLSYFGKTAIEERIVAIMKHKRISLPAILLALALVIFTATALATNGISEPAAPPQAVQQDNPDGSKQTSSPPTADAADSLGQSPEAMRAELAQSLAIYEPFGMVYDQASGQLYMNGQPVRYFRDILQSNGQPLDSGDFSGSMRSIPSEYGTVDVYAVRDENNNLVGLRVASQQEFDQRTQAWANGAPIAQEAADTLGASDAPKPLGDADVRLVVDVNGRQVRVMEKGADGAYSALSQAFGCAIGDEGAMAPGVYGAQTGPGAFERYDQATKLRTYCSFNIAGRMAFHSALYRTVRQTDHETRVQPVDELPPGGIRLAFADALWIWTHCPAGTVVEILAQ